MEDLKNLYINEVPENSLDFHKLLIAKLADDLSKKKEEIIKQKFAEKGFSHLLDGLDKRRFKRIVVESNADCEKYYADNGTDDGVLIVTFFRQYNKFTKGDSGEFGIKAEIKYI